MDALVSLLTSSIGSNQAQMLVLFLAFWPPFFFAYWAVKRGLPFVLRPLPGYEALKRILGQAAEAGLPIHLSIGIAGIGDRQTADTTAGLYVLDYIAERAAISAIPPIVTLSHPTALPAAMDVLRRAYRRQGNPEEYDPTRARWIAPDPNLSTGFSPNPSVHGGPQTDAFAYAAGTMHLLSRQKLIANVMVGSFGDEFLLLGETGARQHLDQIAGTSAPEVLPFVYTSVTHPLIGEEIFAAGAYLQNRLSHVSSLIAQDVMRWFIVAAILAGVLLKTIGFI